MELPFSLHQKKALVVGVANEYSIAWGCAKAFRAAQADVAVTYLNGKAETHVRPLAEKAGAEIILPLNVETTGEDEAVFEVLRDRWGKLDILLHSIAFCEKKDLQGRVIDCSSNGFSRAMDVSVHSFLRLLRLAEPLMCPGSTAMTVTFYGSERVVDDYNIMGPVKASLEAVTRYAAAELGEAGISVHALSPGPLATRAASGIAHFDAMLSRASQKAPTRTLATIEDVGSYATFLSSEAARNVTGCVHRIDGGYSIVS
ncbi:MAG: enoyl-ACP reductase FabI [Pseudomonadota bacterium]